MNKVFGVYGASGFGREVMPLVRQQYGHDYSQFVFVDDGEEEQPLNGHDVLTFEKFLQVEGDKAVCIAIADSGIRKLLTDRCRDNGVMLAPVKAENVVIMDEVSIGAGSIITPFCTVTSNVKIGRSFHANIYSYIAHDCEIGDFVTFAPNVKCNGNVKIEDGAYLGTGAILKQGQPGKPLVIGEGAVVGMGAVVTKSVAPGDVVIGNPAKSIKRGTS